MEQLGYSASRKTQENIDFRDFLDTAIDDGNITPDEAKILVGKYEAVRDTMVDGKKQILAMSKDELASLSEVLEEERLKVASAVDKIYSISNSDIEATEAIEREELFASFVPEIPLEENDVDFEEMTDDDFYQHLHRYEGRLKYLWIDTTKDIVTQLNTKPEVTEQLQVLLATKLPLSQREEFQIDGKIWIGTHNAIENFISMVEGVNSIEDILLKYDLKNYEYDTNLAWLDEFTDTYGFLCVQIEETFGLDNYTLASVAWQESGWGRQLTSPTNAKWLCWITRSLANDQSTSWQTKKYLALLQWENWENKIAKLLNTIDPNGNKISDMMPDMVSNMLISLWEVNNEKDASVIFSQLWWIMKSSNTSRFIHALNLIMSGLYTAHLLIRHKSKWKDYATLRYNWWSDANYVQNVENRKQELLKDPKWSQLYKSDEESSVS